MGPSWVAPRGPRAALSPGQEGGRSPLGLLHPILEGAQLWLSLPAVPSPSACAPVAKQEAGKCHLQDGKWGPGTLLSTPGVFLALGPCMDGTGDDPEGPPGCAVQSASGCWD